MKFYDLKKQTKEDYEDIASNIDKHLNRWIKTLEAKQALSTKEEEDLKFYKKLKGGKKWSSLKQ